MDGELQHLCCWGWQLSWVGAPPVHPITALLKKLIVLLRKMPSEPVIRYQWMVGVVRETKWNRTQKIREINRSLSV